MCVFGRPASFRNNFDAKYWKKYLNSSQADEISEEIALFGKITFALPVDFDLSLNVLHLYATREMQQRDVDNTAKPIMDAFNKVLYNDDRQVRDLRFTSAPIFSKLAESILAENNRFLAGLLSAATGGARRRPFDDATIIVLRDITGYLEETEGDYFLGGNKAGFK